MVIPVFHKEEAIAYAFVGDYETGDFSKIQLITTITNIVSVAIENKRLFKRQIEQARFNHEMKLASEMQRALVPDELPKESFLKWLLCINRILELVVIIMIFSNTVKIGICSW